MSPNGKRIRDGKNADLKFYERTDDVEKWESPAIDWRAKEPDAARHIWWSGNKKQQAYQMHKYTLWTVYLFTFPLSPNDKMKVP